MARAHDTMIAIFGDYREADATVGKIIDDGLDISNFSVAGKGCHSEDKVTGFYSAGDSVKCWGKYGAFWGGLWGLLADGGIFVTIPVVGTIVVVGPLAAMVVPAIDGRTDGGLSALGAGLFSAGIPEESVTKYESAIKADKFLVVAQGTEDEMLLAKAIFESAHPAQLDVYKADVGVRVPVASGYLSRAAA